ncbi:unnamed protein product [Miscanthus lutarioriparius]|uniref:Transposase (putative) gypsy type domain-containing protein n=1 Tax=Miscanthus lutarioriparius TaxID=422564 RepID=A0A811RDB9_9POAL|nr:unnamed protein product [Miscanthus lutarioriparius]
MSDQEKNASTNSPVGSNHSDLGEDLSDVFVSKSKLVGDDTKSLKFGKTLMDDKELDWMVTNRMVEMASVHLAENEVVLDLKPYECVVFRDQFAAGLRMPCQDFLEELLKAYNIEMHHLTSNGIAKITHFVWAMKSQDVNLDIRAFGALHEMHTQFRNKNMDGKTIIKYFGRCNFKPARGAKQISPASKNKWVENWYRY